MDTVILTDIKRMLGIEESASEFDVDIISGINSAFFTLWQLGVGLDGIIRIEQSTTWDEIATSIPRDVLREYLYLKTKAVFDPATTSVVANALQDRISELEFRMNIHVDNGGGVVSG